MSHERITLVLLQVIALALPTLAIMMQLGVRVLNRMERQYNEGVTIHTPTGDRSRTRQELSLQQFSLLLLQLSFIILVLSAVAFLSLIPFTNYFAHMTTIELAIAGLALALVAISLALFGGAIFFMSGKALWSFLSSFRASLDRLF